MTQEILIYVLGALIVILAAWVALLERRLKKLFRGKKAGEFEDILRRIASELEELHAARADIEKYLETVERRLQKSVQHVGAVRFNPFQEVGGDQSFALALLDEKKNGLVISSLYGRESSRIYAKPLEGGKSKYQLSREEVNAIEEALKT
ncbi:MAG: DUF4446 family protein [Patescibacteria group bacterium]